jgi:hypothetical protein
MSINGISYVLQLINNIIIIILLIFVYTYLTSLEAKGCECAQSPNSNFIKNFTIFAIIYLLLTMFIPDSVIGDNLGTNVLVLKKVIDLIFALVFVYYIYIVFQYTRYLVNEKCKCSVDIRREIIMIGFLIEFALIIILFLFHFIIVVISSVFLTVIKEVYSNSNEIHGIIRDPIGSLSKVPKTIKKDIGEISSFVSQTKKELSKIGKGSKGSSRGRK